MLKWIKLIKWIRNHRKKGNCAFNVVTDENTFVITVEGCECTYDSWEENMLRIPY